MNQIKSDFEDISLLFLIYVNDLYKCSEKINPVMFADDTNLFLSGINVDDFFYMNWELKRTYLYGLKQTNYR